MIKFFRPSLFLLLIIFLAAFLRFWQLGHNPPSLTWDEAAWGYNAYTLGLEGRDEFGRLLPYDYLESFGDFKPPVYAYLDILPIKIFGLNEFAVRFPSAFFGTLTVLITYFLTRRIFSSSPVALVAVFMLAISPWHINLSRAAFEANIASFFIASSVLTFLMGVQERRWFLLVSAILFGLSFFTFNTARVVVPLLILALGICFRKELWQRKKETLLALVIGIFIVLPIVPFLFSPQASLRFREVNIFFDLDITDHINKSIENDNNSWWSRIMHNRRFVFSVEYLKHYLDHFNPAFLFIKGDGNPKFSTQDVGQLYLWDLPFFILGILLLIRKKEKKWFLVPVWMLLGIIPAATARETPHALRIESTLPTFQILVAYGAFYAFNALSKVKHQILKIKIKYLIFSLVFLFLIFNFLYYIHGYYAHYPREFSGEWQFGYKESIGYVKEVQNEYDEVRVTTKLGRPYIYYAFYTQVSPEVFRKTVIAQRDPFGFVTIAGFDKYRFSDNIGSIKSKSRRVLFIDVPQNIPKKVQVLKTFYLLNGEPALVAYRK